MYSEIKTVKRKKKQDLYTFEPTETKAARTGNSVIHTSRLVKLKGEINKYPYS